MSWRPKTSKAAPLEGKLTMVEVQGMLKAGRTQATTMTPQEMIHHLEREGYTVTPPTTSARTQYYSASARQ
jgi:hypothetical protein